MSSNPFNPFHPDIPSRNHVVHVSPSMRPPFPEWAKRKLNQLYSADSEESFNAAFDNLIARDANEFSIDGKVQDRPEFKRRLWEEVKASSDGVQVKQAESDSAGEAKIAFEAPGGISRSLHLKIIEDHTLIPPRIPLSGRPGFIDRRRAAKVVLT
ncbi:unnamed protein product [Somion occarium]|uniref:Uncharacterized protein n=1 Tax=Somion occarium TaxID=3059160 RepID=A0ABP1CSE7_9APHY